MRSIKFRGKSKNDGRWIYGDFVRLPKDRGIYYSNEPPSSEQEFYIASINFLDKRMIPVIPNTIGQYTGIRNTNNEEIYEDDILDVHDCKNDKYYRGIVKYEFGSFYLDTGSSKHYRWYDYEIEKINNTFDNINALEGMEW